MKRVGKFFGMDFYEDDRLVGPDEILLVSFTPEILQKYGRTTPRTVPLVARYDKDDTGK